MAKNNKEQLPDIPETMEDYMLQQLKKTVILKDGNTLKDPHDGHELTAEEAIAHNMINAAMKGDVKAATCGAQFSRPHFGQRISKSVPLSG